MQSGYKTVKQKASAEMVVKKSKFIANVSPVTTEQEAIDFIHSIKKQHAQATHNVYAYMVREQNLSRYTDDGEPSMTAGIPVYEVFSKQHITDVCVVVTRYFGGTLLGTGGLVRAYSGACQAGLKASGVIKKVLCDIMSLVCDYSLYGKVEYLIKNKGYLILDTKFEAVVTMTVCIKTALSKSFCDTVLDETNALVVPQVTDTRFVDEDVILEEESL